MCQHKLALIFVCVNISNIHALMQFAISYFLFSKNKDPRTQLRNYERHSNSGKYGHHHIDMKTLPNVTLGSF